MSAEPRTNLLYEEDGNYIVIPGEFGRKLVDALLPDLPEERRAVIAATIDEWGSEWGDLVSSSTTEYM